MIYHRTSLQHLTSLHSYDTIKKSDSYSFSSSTLWFSVGLFSSPFPAVFSRVPYRRITATPSSAVAVILISHQSPIHSQPLLYSIIIRIRASLHLAFLLFFLLCRERRTVNLPFTVSCYTFLDSIYLFLRYWPIQKPCNRTSTV